MEISCFCPSLNSLFSDNTSADDSLLRAVRQAATPTVLLLRLQTLAG
jgi:hypothetical protein